MGPKSLHAVNEYRAPGPLLGETTPMLWVLPGAQFTVTGAVKAEPSIRMARPAGLVAMVTGVVAPQLLIWKIAELYEVSIKRGTAKVESWATFPPFESNSGGVGAYDELTVAVPEEAAE